MNKIKINLKHIEAFLLVAKLSSFRKAAVQQCITQPAVSSRIAMLEADLGVQLFQRNGNSKTKLTAKGQELLAYAERLINVSKEFVYVANQKKAYSGLLRLGISETIAHTWLTGFLKYLSQNFPSIVIELTIDISANLTKQLLDNSIDIAFLMGPTKEPEISDVELWSTPLYWFASKELNLTNDCYDIESLAQWKIITYARNTIPYNEISQKLVNTTAQIYCSSSLSVCKQMVINGVCISALPKSIVKKDIDKQLIQEIITDWRPTNLSFTASYAVNYHKSEFLVIIDIAKTIANNYTA